MGLSLRNPLIVGSSGLTDTPQKIQELEKAGAGAVVLKSLFEEEILLELESNLQKMQSANFIYPETLEFYEYEETDERLAADYINLIEQSKKAVDIPVIASINCVTAQEWTYFPKEIERAGADALELNIFILPTDFDRTRPNIEKTYFDILKTVKAEVDIPVALKTGFHFSDLGVMLQNLSKNVDALVLFNRFFRPDFDIDNLTVTSAGVLSTPEDLYIPLRWISIMNSRVECDLAASTGIHDYQAFVKQLLAGAKAVQVVSSIYAHGNDQIKKILEGVEKWMNHQSFDSIEAFRAKLSQAGSSNPAAYERVQFMKHFRHFREL